MYQPVALYIGLRYICVKTSNYFSYLSRWLSAISIAFGVMSMVLVLSIMNGFECRLERNILKFTPQAMLTTLDRKLNSKYDLVLDPKILIDINDVTPLTIGNVLIQSTQSIAFGIMLGINPWDPEPLSNYLIQSKQDDLTKGQYQVILGCKLATFLGVKRGDKIRLIVSEHNQFTPIGYIPSQRLFTVIGMFVTNSEVDNYQLLVNQQDASRLMHYPEGYVSGWRLFLKKPLAIENFKKHLLPEGLILRDWRDDKGELFQALHIEKNMMSLLLSLIVIVATFNIITMLELLIVEKKVETAILRTQGLTRRQVMSVFIINGTSTGIFGVLLGTCTGILLANQLNNLISIFGTFFGWTVLPVNIKISQILSIAFFTITSILLYTIYPSWRASVAYPAETIRHE